MRKRAAFTAIACLLAGCADTNGNLRDSANRANAACNEQRSLAETVESYTGGPRTAKTRGLIEETCRLADRMERIARENAS